MVLFKNLHLLFVNKIKDIYKGMVLLVVFTFNPSSPLPRPLLQHLEYT